ncbi:MAG: LysE family translocator [Alphaproteobacteria bacterium]|nr:LysE family translocator [Alphaproteobacteria bacterium]
MPLDPTLFVGYLVVAAIIVVSPGPDTMLILRYTLAGGRRVGFATLSGVQLGILGHITAAVLGLSVLILSVPIAFKAVAIAGAAYLAFIGVQALRAGTLRISPEAQAQALEVGRARAVRDAIITNLFNPKVIMLFVALMPNFVAPQRASVPLQLVLLGVTLIVINVAWQTGLVLAAARLRQWLTRLSVQRVIAIISGIVFIGFAVMLLIEHVVQSHDTVVVSP